MKICCCCLFAQRRLSRVPEKIAVGRGRYGIRTRDVDVCGWYTRV